MEPPSLIAKSHRELHSRMAPLSIIDYSSVPKLAGSALVRFGGDFGGGQGCALTAAKKFVCAGRD